MRHTLSLGLLGLVTGILAGCQFQPAVTGLRAAYPPVIYAATGEGFMSRHGPPAVKFVKIDSLQPTLKWESFPGKAQRKSFAHDLTQQVEHVTYDLKIWQTAQGEPAALIYERQSLMSTEHRLEKLLLPKTRYCWTVRARFELDGQTRVCGWSFSNLPWAPTMLRNMAPGSQGALSKFPRQIITDLKRLE